MSNKNYSLGIDIGGTKTMFLITRGKDIVYKNVISTNSDVNQLSETIEKKLIEAEVTKDELISVGFGICGITDINNSVVIDAPAVKWFDINLREILKSSFACPVYADNDVNCCIIGERESGLLHGINDAFYIAVGTGIGGALLIGGKVYRGSAFCAGEVGLTICGHDNNFLENRISGRILNIRAGKYKPTLTSRELFENYKNKGEDTTGLINEFICGISVLCANITNILNPETIVIGGGVALSMDCVIEKIRNNVSKYTPIRCDIRLSALENEAAAIGAANLYKYINI